MGWRLALVDIAGVVAVCAMALPPRPALAFSLAWPSLLAAAGCYRPRVFPAGWSGLRATFQSALLMVVIIEVASATWWGDRRATMLTVLAVVGCWSALVRLVDWTRWHVLAVRGSAPMNKAVVIGTHAGVARALVGLDADARLDVVAACLVGPGEPVPGVPTSNGIGKITDVVARHGADLVLAVPCKRLPPEEVRRVAWRLEAAGAELLIVPGLPDVAPHRGTLGVAGSTPLLHVRRAELSGSRRVIKEVWERLGAVAMLLVLAPALAVLALLVRLDSPGTAFYRQDRVGRGGRVFTIYKFRTMVADADLIRADLAVANETDGVLFKVRTDPRVTTLGRLLRRYSLDELPQLWNVVRGDMALVGPRPALPTEVASYEPDMRRRMVVKPGITGLWQVSGRSDLPWRRAVELDLYYVDNWSLGLDLTVVLRTAGAVLAHTGAY